MGIDIPPLKVLVSSLKKILKFGFGFSVGYYTLTHEEEIIQLFTSLHKIAVAADCEFLYSEGTWQLT